MNENTCRHCDTPITFIITAKNKKRTPVLPTPIRRMSSASLPVGKYYDREGNLYSESNVPNGVDVWRSHWGDCPREDAIKK